MAAVRPLGELRREHVLHRRRTSGRYAIKPMNCPGHVQIFNQGLQQLSRPAAALRASSARCHRYEPSGALHGLMRVRGVHPGRRPHLLHRGPDRPRRRSRIDLLMLGLRDFGFDDVADQVLRPPAEARRRATRSGTRPKARSCDGARAAGARVHAEPGRGRLLRPEARVRAQGRHRPRLAVRHLAGRSQHARPPRRRTTSTRTARSARPSCCTGPSSARWSASSAS